MKKRFVLILTFLMFQTNVVFAQPDNQTVGFVSELKRISESIGVIIDSVVDGVYDSESITKELLFQDARLNSVISELHFTKGTTKNKLSESRESAGILYIAAAYKLSVNGINIYMQDKNEKQYFIDAIVEHREANRLLVEFIKSVESKYKVKIN